MVIFEKLVLPSSWLQFLYICLHSVTYVMNWPLYMLAARYISGNTINIVVSTSVVFMLIPQYTILSSILPGNRNWKLLELFSFYLNQHLLLSKNYLVNKDLIPTCVQ